MEDIKIKHLEFIQNIITRMNTNSFQLKGMCVAIVSAFLAIYASNKNVLFIFLPIVPTALFWFLDTFYLQQEEKFRGIYNNVAGIEKDIEIRLFEMPIHEFQKDKYSFWSVFFSKTILPFYGIISILLFVAGIVLTLIFFDFDFHIIKKVCPLLTP